LDELAGTWDFLRILELTALCSFGTRRFSACYCFADVEVAGAFCSKSSSTFANVKRINMIRISSNEIGSSLAQHITGFRAAQSGSGEETARRP
jgi:hypothetical protein